MQVDDQVFMEKPVQVRSGKTVKPRKFYGVDALMCLAVPSKIVEIKDSVALVDVDGVTREASILLLDDVQVGDYVIVHAGFAISRIDAETAELTLKEMRQMLSFQDQGAVD